MFEWSRKLLTRVLKVIGIEQPALIGNLHAELVFFVALAVERFKAGVVGVGVVDDGPGRGEQRRGLIEAAIEAAEDPVQFGNLEGNANSRHGVVFCEA